MSNYNTIEEIKTILDETIYAGDWDLFVAKEAASTMATKAINQLKFSGTKTESTQENEFPRDDDALVPDAVRRAHALEASAISRGADPEMDYQAREVKSTAFSGMRTTFSRGKEDHVIAGITSITAWRLLLPYLNHDSSLTLSRV